MTYEYILRLKEFHDRGPDMSHGLCIWHHISCEGTLEFSIIAYKEIKTTILISITVERLLRAWQEAISSGKDTWQC